MEIITLIYMRIVKKLFDHIDTREVRYNPPGGEITSLGSPGGKRNSSSVKDRGRKKIIFFFYTKWTKIHCYIMTEM